MAFNGFGYTEGQIQGLMRIQDTLMIKKGFGGISSISAQIASADLYLFNMGIVGADSKNPIMDLIALHPKENYSLISASYKRRKELISADVYKHTGINVHDMLEYPPHVVDEYLSICREKIKRDAEALKDMQDKFTDTTK